MTTRPTATATAMAMPRHDGEGRALAPERPAEHPALAPPSSVFVRRGAQAPPRAPAALDAARDNMAIDWEQQEREAARYELQEAMMRSVKVLRHLAAAPVPRRLGPAARRFKIALAEVLNTFVPTANSVLEVGPLGDLAHFVRCLRGAMVTALSYGIREPDRVAAIEVRLKQLTLPGLLMDTLVRWVKCFNKEFREEIVTLNKRDFYGVASVKK